jgi:hypothetical protein
MPVFSLGSSEGPIVLGYPWFRAFFVQFDYAKSSVSFAANSKADFASEIHITPIEQPADSISTWTIVGIVIGGVVFLAVVVGVGCCCYRKHKNKK